MRKIGRSRKQLSKTVQGVLNAQHRAIGKEVRKRRVRCGLTMAVLAGRVGLSQAQLCRLENGEQGFRLDVLYRLACHLGTKVHRILKAVNV